MGRVRWNRKMWPLEFNATPEASPSTQSAGNSKKSVETLYPSSGTGFEGGITCAPARDAQNIEAAQSARSSTLIMELPPESSISVCRNYMNLGEAQRRYECVNDCGSLKQWSDRQVAVGI